MKSSSLFSRKQPIFPHLSNRFLSKEIESDLLNVHDQLKGPFKDMHELREATIKTAQYILKKDHLRLQDLKNNPERFFSLLELFGIAGGGSLATLLGVQLLLAGGGVMNLMDPKKSKELLSLIEKGDLWGCFAMTELGHGTNVPGIETLAIFDKDQQEFIIDNVNYIYEDGKILTCDPKETIKASKMFIGNAPNSDFGIVFAQLIIKENNQYVSKGPHAFFVPFKENSTKINFMDLGEKFGLNGICNAMIRFDNVRIPLSNLMMHNLVQFSKEGVYEKLVSSLLKNLYSAIKYGRTYISCTSQVFITVMSYLGIHLKAHPLCLGEVNGTSFGLGPSQHSIAKWLSFAVALSFAKKSLLKKLNQQPDAVATGLKVLSTTLVEQVYQEISLFIPQQSFMSIQLIKQYNDCVASWTYEGDNAVILQKVIGDLLLHLQSLGKKFQFKKDLPFLFEILNGIKGIFHIDFGDPVFNEMKEQCWVYILTLSMKIKMLMQASIENDLKIQVFSQVWSESQFLINTLANLYTALFVLKEFESQILLHEQIKNLYIIFRTEVYTHFYLEIFKHTDTLCAPLIVNGIPLHSKSYDYFKRLLKLEIPKETITELNKQQKEAEGKVAPYFNDIIKSLITNPTLIDCIKNKFILEEETKEIQDKVKVCPIYGSRL